MSEKTEKESPQFLSSGELAKKLHLRRCQLIYLLQCGVIPEPELRAGGKRLFSPQEVRQAEECLRKPAKSTNCSIEIIEGGE